jgi:hypothetical protein
MSATRGVVSDPLILDSPNRVVADDSQGLMPISGAKDETRKLFFWFFPAKHIKHINDLVCVSVHLECS